MPPVRPRPDAPLRRWQWLALIGWVCLVAGAGLHGAASGPAAPVADASPFVHGTSAVAIVAFGPPPSEVTVGVPAAVAWQAVDGQGVRVGSFAVASELAVTEVANGSPAPAWVNSSLTGPLERATNGTFPIPASAWSGGALELTLDLAAAVPVRVDLFGPLLPTVPEAVPLSVLPDLDHLTLYDATDVQNQLSGANRSYSAFWLVRDRFGDPAPGATLTVECAIGSSVNVTVVPVVRLTDGSTGAWVNATVPGTGSGSVAVLDGAGATVLGPLSVPAVAPAAPPSGPTLSPTADFAVALLAVGGVGGVGALLAGGRKRPAPSPEEGELRRLAEGRASVVEMVRARGPLSLREIEAAWEPPPAPPALADWVASLVTDGTLTAQLDGGGTARFALVEATAGGPKVTLDAEALAQGIRRRDAAVEPDDSEDAVR